MGHRHNGTERSSCQPSGITLTPASSCNIAEESYESALKFIETEFAEDQKALEVITRGTTKIEDIETAVDSIKKAYEDRPGRWKGARDILQKFSQRVVYYGNVFDTLAQRHPEYVSLAWGTLKFVLMVRMTVIVLKVCADIVERASSTMLSSSRNWLQP